MDAADYRRPVSQMMWTPLQHKPLTSCMGHSLKITHTHAKRLQAAHNPAGILGFQEDVNVGGGKKAQLASVKSRLDVYIPEQRRNQSSVVLIKIIKLSGA